MSERFAYIVNDMACISITAKCLTFASRDDSFMERFLIYGSRGRLPGNSSWSDLDLAARTATCPWMISAHLGRSVCSFALTSSLIIYIARSLLMILSPSYSFVAPAKSARPLTRRIQSQYFCWSNWIWLCYKRSRDSSWTLRWTKHQNPQLNDGEC